MKQYDAINIISKTIVDDGLVEACFLKGSIARQEEDEYSDVDFYCLVSPENVNKFLDKRLSYLETYKPILYLEEVNFVGPQLVCIYEDGLHFDLYMQTLGNLNHADQALVIYDPKKLLENYKHEELVLTNQELGKLVNEFSYTLMDVYTAFKREDFIFSYKLVNVLHSLYTQVLRSFVDPKRSKIPCKGLIKNLSETELKDYLEVIKLIKYDKLLIATKALIMKMQELIGNLPIKIAEVVNYDFFLFAKKLIYSINEE